MLRADVVEAVAGGTLPRLRRSTRVDEALEILTGVPAGERGRRRALPRGHASTAASSDRLAAFAEKARSFSRAQSGGEVGGVAARAAGDGVKGS